MIQYDTTCYDFKTITYEVRRDNKRRGEAR